MSNINKMISAFRDGGIPKNRFECIFTLPSVVSGDTETLNVLCKDCTLPELSIGTVEVDYFGRKANFAGDRVIEPINMTFHASIELYKTFEDWSNLMNSFKENVGSVNVFDYFGSVVVNVLDRGDSVKKSISYDNIFPTKVSNFELSHGDTNSTQEIKVTFVRSE